MDSSRDLLFEEHVSQVLEAAEWLEKRIKSMKTDMIPEVAIITGSASVGHFRDHFENHDIFDDRGWQEAGFPPSLPKPKAKGHKPGILIGTVNGVRVLWVQGRVHFYERPTNPYRHLGMVRALGRLGVKNLILTNAAGSLVCRLSKGSICCVSDVDPSYMGHAPLGGDIERIEELFGPFFPAMNPGLDLRLKELAMRAGEGIGVFCGSATYAATAGPTYESALQAKNMLGKVDLVGMSSVPELMAAVQMGMRVVIISSVTNMIATEILPSRSEAVTHESVTGASREMGEELAGYLACLIKLIGEDLHSGK